MNNRRSFFKSLLGLFLAPKIAKAVNIVPEHPSMLGHEAKNIFKAGIIYAPYMPLLKSSTISAEDCEKQLSSGTIELYDNARVAEKRSNSPI